MTTNDFITQLFCRVDDKLNECCQNNKHSQANLYPSEVVTLGLLFALKGQPCFLSLVLKRLQGFISQVA